MNPKQLLKGTLKIGLLMMGTLAVGVPLLAIPATISLPPGPRPGVKPLTISKAAKRLRNSAVEGWDLIEAARVLVAERMQYSRRNSFDSAPKAFSRGYGYCTQMAFALTYLLRELGFEARVVQAFQNRFPDGTVGAHAWVSVTHNAQTRYVDPLYWDATHQTLDFAILSRVTGVGPLFKAIAYWGATGLNAYRYYKTGADH